MTDLTRYAYDARTGAYVGLTAAHPDPLNTDRLLEPALATIQAPPEAMPGQVAVWDGETWGAKPDHRGEVWFSGAEPVLVDFLGDPADRDLSRDAPPLPEPPKPTSCTRLGLMRAFKARSLWETVRAMIASNAEMAEEWDLAVSIQKTDPLIQVALAALARQGIAFSDADVDKLIADAVAAVAAPAQAAA